MPLFMDVDSFDGRITIADVVAATNADPSGGSGFGVTVLRYWVCETAGKVFRLVEADDLELVDPDGARLPGLIAHDVFPVSEHAPSWSRTS